MRDPRDLIEGWSYLDQGGVEPPLWLAVLLCVPGIVGIALLPFPDERVVAIAGIMLVVALVIAFWTSAPFVLFKDNPQELLPVAIAFGVLAIAGRWSSAVAYVGVPLAIAAVPVLVRWNGLYLEALSTMLFARDLDTRTAAWLAKPDDTAMALQPVRVEGDDVVCRIADGEREIVLARKRVAGSLDFGHRYIAFDPKPVLDTKPSGEYRGIARERIDSLAFKIDEPSTLRIWLGEIVAGFAMIALAHAVLLAITIGVAFAIS